MLSLDRPFAGSPSASPALAGTSDASRRFYVRLAWACAIITFAGFTPTYWAPLAAGDAAVPPVVHLHGLLFFAWTVLFVVQARLAAARRLQRHRMVGLAGVSLATAMIFSGAMVSAHGLRGGIERGQGDNARSFSIITLSMLVAFGVAVAVAIANVRRPEVHMRLMVVASVAILPPAIARIFFFLVAPGAAPGLGPPPPLAFTLLPTGLGNLLLVAAMVHDWRVRGRPHVAYVIGGACLLVVQVGRLPLATTPAWHAATEWLLRLFG